MGAKYYKSSWAADLTSLLNNNFVGLAALLKSALLAE